MSRDPLFYEDPAEYARQLQAERRKRSEKARRKRDREARKGIVV